MLTFVGYDSWRDWRDDGRFAYAFFGYRENTPAGRSAHAAEIHIYGIGILDDLKAGGCSPGAIWRRAPGTVGFFPRNLDILWHI
jgi:hypothetical protein